MSSDGLDDLETRRAVTASDAEIVELAKVELHVHFGGNVEEGLAVELAQRHGIELPAALSLADGRYRRGYRGFGDFLAALIAVNDLVRTADDVEAAAAAIARRQVDQNVVYTELIVTALSHVHGGIAARDFWSALRSGLSEGGAAARFGIIVDAIRNDGPGDLVETLRLIDDADAPIVGIGLTGVEDTWPIEDFAFIRRAADDRGLGVEVHAGEMGPPSSITASLDVLGADRIGHGVAAIYDETVLARLVRDQVPVELCPTSNLEIGLFESIETHPVGRFWAAGVNMTVSSDDPPLMGTTLTDELRKVTRIAGLSRDDLVELQRRAALAAFLPATERAALVRRIERREPLGGN